MRFEDFEKVVLTKHPEATVFKHGEYAGNKINVAVIFSPTSKVYKYNGTYVEVLNKLGIKACYKHDIKQVEDVIDRLRRTNGEEDWFGNVRDNTAKIEEYTAMLADMKQMVIC